MTAPHDEDDLLDPPDDALADIDMPELDDEELLRVADDTDPVADDDLMAVDADTEAHERCPHCGEEQELTLDPAGGTVQEYVEDCFVCCRPYTVLLSYDDRGEATVQLEPADGD
jgi:hypothetical protein